MRGGCPFDEVAGKTIAQGFLGEFNSLSVKTCSTTDG